MGMDINKPICEVIFLYVFMIYNVWLKWHHKHLTFEPVNNMPTVFLLKKKETYSATL